jgi:tetratricopeptide (TPR) repeat protein
MIQPGNISHWLQHPDTLTASEKQQLDVLLGQYPYFIPARLLSAAFTHKSRPFSARVSDTGLLYAGNPVQYYDLLMHTAGNKRTFTIKEEEISNQIPENISADQENMGATLNEENLIQPIYTEDYFLHQGISVGDSIPQDLDHARKNDTEDKDMALMRMMSFSEWLMYFKTKNEKEKEEEEDKRALKSMWQKEKLAAAMEAENDEIPETVFEMAVNSITKEEGLVSESLAEILIKQGKYDKAVEMYRKLSLRNPQKNAYFAQKIDAVLKDKKS